jgi:hypothetical protein
MTTHEAAEILDVTVGVVEQKLASGELESRMMADGTAEVLIGLPEMPAVPVHAAMAPMVDVLGEVERRLGPPAMPANYPAKRDKKIADTPSQPLQWTRTSDVRRAKRHARFAWAMTVLVMVGAGAALEVVWQRAVDSRLKVEAIMGAVHRMSATNVVLAAERIRLDGELAEAHATLSKAHEELAVERNIEDTLLKAAIRKRDGVADVGTAFADGGQ